MPSYGRSLNHMPLGCKETSETRRRRLICGLALTESRELGSIRTGGTTRR